MTAKSELHFEVLGKNQLRVLESIAPLVADSDFYLAGGTALALRFGHRESEDFDWFRQGGFDPVSLLRDLRGLAAVEEVSSDRGTLHAVIDEVRVSFLEYDYPLLQEPEWFESPGFRLARLNDLAAMKLAALLQRGERKDFYDLDAMLLEHRSLAELLLCFQGKFDFDGTAGLLRAVAYFDDADKTPDPPLLDERLDWTKTRQRLTEAVRESARG